MSAEANAAYVALFEKCKTGEIIGRVCPKCGSPMVICEKTRHWMICRTWIDRMESKEAVTGEPCASYMVETPPTEEIKEAALLADAPVATWTHKVQRTGKPNRKGKRSGKRTYSITGRTGVFFRDPDGTEVALRFLSRSFEVDRFCVILGVDTQEGK